MGDFRRRSGEYDYLGGTDSVILNETFVLRGLKQEQADTSRGDVLSGLRNGLMMSAAIWSLLFLAARIFPLG